MIVRNRDTAIANRTDYICKKFRQGYNSEELASMLEISEESVKHVISCNNLTQKKYNRTCKYCEKRYVSNYRRGNVCGDCK